MTLYVPERKVWKRQPQHQTVCTANHYVAINAANSRYSSYDGLLATQDNEIRANKCFTISPAVGKPNTNSFSIIARVIATNALTCGIWRSNMTSPTFCLVQTSGYPWIRLNGVDVLKPTSGPTVLSSTLQTVAFVFSPGRYEFWSDGKLLHSSTNSTAIVSNLIFSVAGAQFEYTQYASPSLFVVLDGIAYDFESLTTNPWQLFAPRRQWFALGSASSGIDLSATAQSSATATGAVNQTITLSGASVALATATGVVNQTIGIAGSAASISVANGVATITTTLSGDAFNQAFASGLINQAVAIDSSANAQSSATGSMGLSVTLSGDALAQAIASASFDGALTALSATAQSSATATGALIAEIALAGDAEIIVTSSAGLTHTQTLTGAGAVVASGSGNLSLNAVGLSGNAIAQVLAGGSIQFVTQIEANALAQVTAQMINTGIFASDRKIEKWTMRPARNYALIALSRNYTLAAVA